jgi:hypothetical protein
MSIKFVLVIAEASADRPLELYTSLIFLFSLAIAEAFANMSI